MKVCGSDFGVLNDDGPVGIVSERARSPISGCVASGYRLLPMVVTAAVAVEDAPVTRAANLEPLGRSFPFAAPLERGMQATCCGLPDVSK